MDLKKDVASLLFGDIPRVKIVRLFVMFSDKDFALADLMGKLKLSRIVLKNELSGLVRSKVLAMRSVKNVATWHLVDGQHTQALQHLFTASVQKESVKRLEKIKKAGRLVFAAMGGKVLGNEFAPVDLLLVGVFNHTQLHRVVRGLEEEFAQELQYMVLTEKEFIHRLDVRDRLLCSFFEHSHEVWFNKGKIVLP
jgi:hypothetical protein